MVADTHPLEMAVDAVAGWRNNGGDVRLLDVREDWELEICVIDGSLHIPLGQLPDRLGEVPRDVPVVVVCHHGARSMQGTLFLRQSGVGRAINLAGGIDAWAREIDPAMAVY